MAGARRRPGQKKVKPSEGNTVRRNGRKPPNDFATLALFLGFGHEWNSKKCANWQKFVLGAIKPSRARSSGLEQIGIVAACHVGM